MIIQPADPFVALVTFPRLPPAVLGKNSRGHWTTRHRAYQALKREAWAELRMLSFPPTPYPRLALDVRWRQAGVVADVDAVIARCAPILDAVAAAGFVDNDRDIELGVIARERVRTRADEGLTIALREPDALSPVRRVGGVDGGR